jgi:hypothetical protein
MGTYSPTGPALFERESELHASNPALVHQGG